MIFEHVEQHLNPISSACLIANFLLTKNCPRSYARKSHCHGFSCRSPALVLNSHHLTFRALHGNHSVSTQFQTIVEEDTKKIVTHVSVHAPTFHETHYPLLPKNPNTIQHVIPGRATNVELPKQMENWQSPSRDPRSNCPINSWESTKSQTNYYSSQQKDNSKTICFRARNKVCNASDGQSPQVHRRCLISLNFRPCRVQLTFLPHRPFKPFSSFLLM